MRFQIVPFERSHLEEAAALVARRFQELHALVPVLPPRYAQADTYFPLLEKLTGANPGVVAWRQGKLAGFLCGRKIQGEGSKRIFIHEWANAVAIPESTFQTCYVFTGASDRS